MPQGQAGPPAPARRDLETVHSFTAYDLELDCLELDCTVKLDENR